MRSNPLLLFVVLALLAPAVALAEPAVSDSFTLDVTQLDYAYSVAVGPGDTLYGYRPGQPRIYRSTDLGATWAIVYTNNTTPYQSRPNDLFVSSRGWVLFPTSNTGKVELFHGNGSGALRRTGTLTFECVSTTPKATMWNVSEDALGNLWVGEYGGAASDHCANIWKGAWADTGYAWSKVNDANGGGANVDGRHCHGTGVDPVSDRIFAMFGDRGAGYTNPGGYLVRSRDHGATWEARPDPGGVGSGIDLQWLTLGFGNSRRILGTDRGGVGETNFLAYTTDDSTYTKVDSLTSANPIVPWCYSKDPDGRLYVGTVNQSPALATNRIFMSSDHGTSWKWVRSMSTQTSTYSGYYRMSAFTSDGYFFYFVDKPGPSDDATYRARLFEAVNKSDWLVGVGADCDFPDVMAALVHPYVGRGDTLTLKAGQYHRATGGVTAAGRLKQDMTVCGQAGACVVPLYTGAPAFQADSTGIVIRDLDFRTTVAGVDTLVMTVPVIASVGAGATATVRDCNFYSIAANHSGFGICIDMAPSEDEVSGGSLRVIGCTFDQTTNASSSTSKRGPVSAYNVQRVVVDGCAFTRNTSRRAPFEHYITDPTPSAPIDLIIKNSLFAGNTALSTSSGGAIHINWTTSDEENPLNADDADTVFIHHNTLWDNDVATAANGQVYVQSEAEFESAPTASSKIRFEHNIVVGDGADYAMRNPPGSDFATAKWNDCYNNSKNHLWATTQNDTLQVDPDFVTTAYDSTRRFMPQNCTVGASGSSVRVTDATPPSYMGYIDPSSATGMATLVSPANGAASPLATMVVDWTTVAYADSYAVRWGTTCGAGTYATTDTTSTATLAVSPNTTYWWTVRALDCGGWGQWAECRWFGAAADVNRHRRGH